MEFWFFMGAVSFVFAFLTGNEAKSKGRDFDSWFLFGFFTWIVGLFFSFIITTNEAGMAKLNLKNGKNKKCPACAETILSAAIICRYCQHKL